MYTTRRKKIPLETTTTDFIHRQMKFLPKTPTSSIKFFSGIPRLDHYIELTKNNLNNKLPELLAKTEPNLTKKAKASIKSLKNNQQILTIKPADKNLGIVAMNTDDYLLQCTRLLTSKTTYRLAQSYPKEDISRQLTNTLVSFCSQLTNYNNKLYTFIQPKPNQTQIPKFYGIPKNLIHKQYDTLSPIRPIVVHNNPL